MHTETYSTASESMLSSQFPIHASGRTVMVAHMVCAYQPLTYPSSVEASELGSDDSSSLAVSVSKVTVGDGDGEVSEPGAEPGAEPKTSFSP